MKLNVSVDEISSNVIDETYTPLEEVIENIKNSINEFEVRDISDDELQYLMISEKDYPIIPVINKCFLMVIVNKKSKKIVWLSNWFEIISTHQYGDSCYVRLNVNNELIDTEYGIFYPQNIIKLSKYAVIVNIEYAYEISKYAFKKLSKLKLEKYNNIIGFNEHNECLTFNAYDGKLQYTPDISIEKYIDELNKLVTNSPLMLIISCSCASLLLAYLSIKCKVNVKSFIISLFGKSTTGKSTSQILMTSVYSKPNDEKIYTPFFGTNNSIIKRVSNKYGIPQLFDEITVSNNINMENLVYTISMEHEKYRCNSNSNLRDSDKWKTIVITSSEEKLLNEVNMHNRGLEVRCLNFENLQYTNSPEHADNIYDFCNKNYGILGKFLSEYLINSDSEEILKKYNMCREKMRNAVKTTLFDLSERLINEYSLILLSGNMLQDFNLNIKTDEIIKLLAENHNSIAENSNIAENYYNYIMSYVGNNPYSEAIKFSKSKDSIAIIDAVFLNILKKHGATDTKLVIKELDNNGYLIRQKPNAMKSRMTFNGVLCNCYQLKVETENPPKKSLDIKALITDDSQSFSLNDEEELV